MCFMKSAQSVNVYPVMSDQLETFGLVFMGDADLPVVSDVFEVEHLLEVQTFEVVWPAHEVLDNLPLLLVLLVPDLLLVVDARLFDPLLGLALFLIEVPWHIIKLSGDKLGVILKAIAHSVYTSIDVCLHYCVGSYLASVASFAGTEHPRLPSLFLWEKLFAMRIHDPYIEAVLVLVGVLTRIVNRKFNLLSNY